MGTQLDTPNEYGVRDLHNKTSEVIAHVTEGNTVTITNHGRPVAKIVPFLDESLEQWLSTVEGIAGHDTGWLDEHFADKREQAEFEAAKERRLWGR